MGGEGAGAPRHRGGPGVVNARTRWGAPPAPAAGTGVGRPASFRTFLFSWLSIRLRSNDASGRRIHHQTQQKCSSLGLRPCRPQSNVYILCQDIIIKCTLQSHKGLCPKAQALQFVQSHTYIPVPQVRQYISNDISKTDIKRYLLL